jgi:glycosyltransferase involved in cell wall biosynthesis
MFTARTAAAIICNSAAEQRLIASNLHVRRRTTVIPAGMDLPAALVRSSRQDVTSLKDDRKNGGSIILSVGRLEHYKGVEKLVRALPHLPSNYRLVIVGSGPARAAIEAACDSEGVSDRVLFRGGCSDEELHQWYADAAVCVSLSSNESFGLVVLEAATAGCPVVASDIGAHRELTAFMPPDRLYLVPNGSPPAAVAAAIATAVESGRIDPPSSPENHGWRLPTWDSLVKEVLRVYVQVAGSRPEFV